MVRVRVLYQGITHDLDAVAETIEHVGDLLEEFKAPSIARVYNITGCYFVEPSDVLSDVVRKDDQLWITTVERWRECRSLGLARNESGVVDMGEVECSHTRADARRCSMCAMIRSMLAFEVATEREVHRRSISIAGSPVGDLGVGVEGGPPLASNLREGGQDDGRSEEMGDEAGQALGQSDEEEEEEDEPAEYEGAAVVHEGPAELEGEEQGGGVAAEEPLPPPPQPEARFPRYEGPKYRSQGLQAGKGKGQGQGKGKTASQPPVPPPRLASRTARGGTWGSSGSQRSQRMAPKATSSTKPQPPKVSPPRAPLAKSSRSLSPSRPVQPKAAVQHKAAPPPKPTPQRRIEPPTPMPTSTKPPPPIVKPLLLPQAPLLSALPIFPSFSSPLRRPPSTSSTPRQPAVPVLYKPASPRPAFRISVNVNPAQLVRPRPSPARSKPPTRPTPLHPAASSHPLPAPSPLLIPSDSYVAPLLHQWVASQLDDAEPLPAPGTQRHVSPAHRYPLLRGDASPQSKAHMAEQLGSFVEEYALSFATHFAPTLSRLQGSYTLSETDLLLWALFQHAARRGAVNNHLRHVNSEMSLPQLRALCYELLLLQGAIRSSENQTSAAGLPPLLLTALFGDAHRFADLIDVASEAPGATPHRAEGVKVLRAFYAASSAHAPTSTGAADKQHASINFIEFVYLCLHLARAVQKCVAKRERRSGGRAHLEDGYDSPVGGNRRARSPMMWSPPCSPQARRMAGGGLTDVMINMQRHTAHRTSAALRHLLVYHLIPFASHQGQLRLQRQTRLGLLHPSPIPTPAGKDSPPPFPAASRRDPYASQAWTLECNRRQLLAIFQHYSETSPNPSPRHLSTSITTSTTGSSGVGPAGGDVVPLGRSSHVGEESLKALGLQLQLQRAGVSACAPSSALCPSNQSIGRRLSLSRLHDRTRRESLQPAPAVGQEGQGHGAEKRLSLEQLHRFASQFLLLPHIVSLEELATAFRVAQEGEYRAWCVRRQGAGAGQGSGVADMVTRLKRGEEVAVPASPHVLSLSFDGFLHVLNGIALAGYGSDAAHLQQRPLDYLLEHLDSSKGKRHLRQLYAYKVTKPFVLTTPAKRSADAPTSPRDMSTTVVPFKKDVEVDPAGHLVSEEGLSTAAF